MSRSERCAWRCDRSRDAIGGDLHLPLRALVASG
jgi:hypothetical protein